MDYHRYGNLGMGSVPPLIPGAGGLPEHSTSSVAGAPPPIPGASRSLMSHHPNPSLMFHYGVGGKPSLPPHLLPPQSVAANTNASISGSVVVSQSAYGSKPSSSGIGRTTTLGIGSGLSPLTTTAGSSRPISPNSSSSFADALRTLAKQAGPIGTDSESSHAEPVIRSSPKTVTTFPHTSSVVTPAITPTLIHSDRQDSALDVERLGTSEDLLRGFQPYRAPEITACSSAQPQLRPTLPLDIGHSYSYSSLYPHPLSHQYRLEEQLYLERYGLMRPPLPPYGIGSLSSLYQTSPYLSARFPPELLTSSLPALHPSSALLHERLKLEEDIRQREYELELRRERELERERGREREREKERERRHKEHDSEKREDRQKNDSLRDRSPVAHHSSSSSIFNSPKKPSFIGPPTTQPTKPLESRPKPLDAAKPHDLSRPDPSKQKSTPERPSRPGIVRPFESSPSITPIKEPKDKDDVKVIRDTHKEPKVWQPVQLVEPEPVTTRNDPTVIKTAEKSVPLSTYPSVSSLFTPQFHPPLETPKKEPPEIVAETPPPKEPARDSEVKVKIENTPEEKPPPDPPEKPPTPVSRLDLEEQRLRELRESGIEGAEAEEILLEEMQNYSNGFIFSKVPPIPLDSSKEKISFLCMLDLTTHEEADSVELERVERRAKILNPLTPCSPPSADTKETLSSAIKLKPLLVPGLNLCEVPKLKGANSLLSDFPNKRRFLQNLGLHPQYSLSKQNTIDVVWQFFLKERLRRLEKSEDELAKYLLPSLSQLVSAKKLSKENKSKDAAPYDTLNNEITHNSLSAKKKVNCLDAKIKGLLNDGFDQCYGINNLLNHEPLFSNLPAIDKMIDHILKSAEDHGEGNNNTALLRHIEEVRRSQLAVCQTVQLVQDQVAALIKTRTQLEDHRSTLHHHLDAISSLLASNSPVVNHHPQPKQEPKQNPPSTTSQYQATPVSTSQSEVKTSEADVKPVYKSPEIKPSISESTISSSNFNISSLTAKTTEPVYTSHYNGGPSSNDATVTSWTRLYSPFISLANVSPSTDIKNPYLSLKDKLPVVSPIKNKPVITTHSGSQSRDVPKVKSPISHKAKSITSPSFSSSIGKYNGTTNSIIPKLHMNAGTTNSLPPTTSSNGISLVANSSFPPVTLAAVPPSMGNVMPSSLYYVTSSSSIAKSGQTSISKPVRTKTSVNFTPYSKNSPNKLQNWLPNNN